MYHKRGLWAIKAKHGGVFPRHDPQSKATVAAEKSPKFTRQMMSRSRFLISASLNPPSSDRDGMPNLKVPSRLMVSFRRVNQSYVIATSTKVDISGVNVEKFDDRYFAKDELKKKKKGEGEFFEAEKEDKKTLPDEKKEDQKAVDASLIKSIEGVSELKAYLAARFSLKSGMKPHELVF
ncbi:60S ribosomal protein L6 [Hibiscus syriacus]|uniref:60S ribosomal protein L6 n=1 Tax=Hibiscus syriacus TaxID=106335 RepID=A0A6A2XS34_HIBSY|nr:60S ribosomal protein L6 [Hibiscus syriacus]